MAEKPAYRTLVEADEYTAQLSHLQVRYSREVLEAALMGVLWGIATNPEQYDKVTWNIYGAKSRPLNLPRFRIFFQIMDDDHVLLMWIEELGSIDDIMDA
jgi:hypothetical protein